MSIPRPIRSQERSAGPRRPAAAGPGRPHRRTSIAIWAGVVVAVLVVAALIGGSTRSSDGESSTSATSVNGGAASVSDAGAGSVEASTDGATAEQSGPAPSLTPGSESGASTASDAGDGQGAGGSDATFAAQGGPGAPADAKIIRTGDLEVEVAKGSFDASTAQLGTIAANAGGFVSASQTSALDDRPRGSLTLRVPADRFDQVVGDVGEVGDVISVNTSSQDVTGEYTDVASRLKALQAEREQINLVLGRAESIPDILSVRDRLSVVQGEIEQLQGRQKVLEDQTSLGTLTVSVSEKGAAAPVAPEGRSGIARLWTDIVDRFGDGTRAIALGLATMAPWLLMALVLFVPGRAIWRRLSAEPTPPAPPAGPQTATTAD